MELVLGSTLVNVLVLLGATLVDVLCKGYSGPLWATLVDALCSLGCSELRWDHSGGCAEVARSPKFLKSNSPTVLRVGKKLL